MMKEFNLKNGIISIYNKTPNTPRIALSFGVRINKAENIAGVYSLMNRLFMQGTFNRTAEQLALELDENAIELSCDMLQDFLRFRVLCLNEDFEKSVEILADIIKNTTFEDFEKEKFKMQGEITAELDSARTKALDAFVKTLFKNHYYGNTYSKILENIDKITKEDVKTSYDEILKTGKKVLAVVGDVDFDFVQDVLNKYLGNIENLVVQSQEIPVPVVTEPKRTEVIKEDSQQAQIFKGWLVPNFKSEDYAPLCVFNTILGSSGLSSRLFLELRDKKGLAYTVRSAYENYQTCANFNLYIATEPKNIEVSLAGFTEEINKLKNIAISEAELENAKNNISGKQQFVSETNSQKANKMVQYEISDLGFDFGEKYLELIRKVTAEDVQRVANKYFDDKAVIGLLRP